MNMRLVEGMALRFEADVDGAVLAPDAIAGEVEVPITMGFNSEIIGKAKCNQTAEGVHVRGYVKDSVLPPPDAPQRLHEEWQSLWGFGLGGQVVKCRFENGVRIIEKFELTQVGLVPK